jgi:hypothetical protein
MKKDSYSIFEANLTYFIMAVILMTAGAYVQGRDFESGIFITEYVFVLLPVLVVGLLRKVNLKRALRLNKLRVKHGFIISAIAFCLLPTVAFANTLTIYLLSLKDKVIVPPIPTATTPSELGLYFFLIAISAGICEEFFFRGMMLNAFEKGVNPKMGVVISAVLFGVFHFNMQNLLGPIVLGLVFGYIVQLTNSIWAGVVAHMANNGIAVIAGYLGTLVTGQVETAEATTAQLNNSAALLGSLVFLLIVAALFWIAILKLLKVLRNDMNPFEENTSFKIKGVDYLVLSHYNGSVAAVKANKGALAAPDVEHFELKNLRRMKPQSGVKLWHESEIKPQGWKAYMPWIGVVAIYLWYMSMHFRVAS